MMDVTLVYFEGCPQVEAARRNLLRAGELVGTAFAWTEVDVDAPGVPLHLRDLPSPTVLVDGTDVSDAGAPGEDGGSRDATAAGEAAPAPRPPRPGRSCRAAGAPTVELILAALRRASEEDPGRSLT